MSLDPSSKTDLLAQMNTSVLSNDYINKTVTLEQSRLGKLDAMAKRDVYKLRGQSLGEVYSEDKCRFLSLLTRVALFASILVIAVLSATSQDIISKRTGVFVAVAIMLLGGVALLLLVANASTRRNDAWGHYYWGNTKKGSTNDSCSS